MGRPRSSVRQTIHSGPAPDREPTQLDWINAHARACVRVYIAKYSSAYIVQCVLLKYSMARVTGIRIARHGVSYASQPAVIKDRQRREMCSQCALLRPLRSRDSRESPMQKESYFKRIAQRYLIGFGAVMRTCLPHPQTKNIATLYRCCCECVIILTLPHKHHA